MTRPVMTNGRPAISGVARTTKSDDFTTKSASWTMPSLSLSTIVKRPAGCQSVDPGRELVDGGADEVREDGVPREGRVGGCGEVEEEDEEERPADGRPRLADRRGRVVARQDVGKPRRADHEAEGQGEEVPHLVPGRDLEVVLDLGAFLRRGRRLRVELLLLGGQLFLLGAGGVLELHRDRVGLGLPERAGRLSPAGRSRWRSP